MKKSVKCGTVVLGKRSSSRFLIASGASGILALFFYVHYLLNPASSGFVTIPYPSIPQQLQYSTELLYDQSYATLALMLTIFLLGAFLLQKFLKFRAATSIFFVTYPYYLSLMVWYSVSLGRVDYIAKSQLTESFLVFVKRGLIESFLIPTHHLPVLTQLDLVFFIPFIVCLTSGWWKRFWLTNILLSVPIISVATSVYFFDRGEFYIHFTNTFASTWLTNEVVLIGGVGFLSVSIAMHLRKAVFKNSRMKVAKD